MHELGIVFHIMDSLERVAEENSVTRIQSVTVEVGEVSTVLPDYLTDCWKWAREKRELLRGCEMEIVRLPAVTHCEGCGREYPTVRYGKTCPHCGSGDTWLLKGNELNIREITVPEEG